SGEVIPNPRHWRRAAKALKRSEQALSRKQRASANRRKARQRVALRHLRVARGRKDFHYKTALDLVRRFDRIAVEDLKICNMVRHPHLAKSITDAGWSQFTAILARKAENAGRELVRVDPKYTSQTCSACGHRQTMPLAVRVFVCESCAHSLSRDENAARNIGASGPRKPAAAADVSRASRNRNGWKRGAVTRTAPAILSRN